VQPILHLSLPVSDVDVAHSFYIDVLGCTPGRRRTDFADVWFHGLQLTLQRDAEHVLADQGSRHFGVALDIDDFGELLDRLETTEANDIEWLQRRTVDFAGTPQEQRKAKIADPSGNVIELFQPAGT